MKFIIIRNLFTRTSEGFTHIVALRQRQNERIVINENKMSDQPETWRQMIDLLQLRTDQSILSIYFILIFLCLDKNYVFTGMSQSNFILIQNFWHWL